MKRVEPFSQKRGKRLLSPFCWGNQSEGRNPMLRGERREAPWGRFQGETLKKGERFAFDVPPVVR